MSRPCIAVEVQMLIGLEFRRFGFVALLIGVMALSMVLVSSRAGAVQGTVRMASAAAGIGQEASVTLSAVDVGSPGLGAWTLDVAYDPAVVSVVACRAEYGGICNELFSQGVVRVTGISVGGLDGTVDLAHMTFLCIAGGTSALAPSIDVFSDASLGDPWPIAAVIQGGAIACTEDSPTATPQPAATATPEQPAEPPGSEPDKLPGDADCDGDVDAIDAAHVLQFEARLLSELACAENADANHDGTAGPIDAAIILQTTAGLIS